MESKGFWRGQPLEEYSKEELIDIIIELGRSQRAADVQKWRDIDALMAKPR